MDTGNQRKQGMDVFCMELLILRLLQEDNYKICSQSKRDES